MKATLALALLQSGCTPVDAPLDTGPTLSDTDTASSGEAPPEPLPWCEAVAYEVEPLEMPFDGVLAEVYRVNALGDAVGAVTLLSGTQHAAIWRDTELEDLEDRLPDDVGRSVATDLVEGAVVGWAYTYWAADEVGPTGLRWVDGSEAVRVFDDTAARIWAAGPNGLLVGDQHTELFALQPDGELVAPGLTVGPGTDTVGAPLAVSDSGAVVGAAWTSAVRDAFSWVPGEEVTWLGATGFEGSEAFDAHDEVAVGRAWRDDLAQPVLWSDGELLELGLSDDALLGEARAINARGEVIGFEGEGYVLSLLDAWVWRSAIKFPLDGLIDDDNWTIDVVTDINDSGQIVGMGTRDGDEWLPVRLTPICD